VKNCFDPHTNFHWHRATAAALWPTTIFNMAATRHLELQKIHIWSRPSSAILKMFIFDHLAVIEFQTCCCTKFHQNQIFFVEIWWLYDFQDGGSPPSWILGVQQWFLWKTHVGLPSIETIALSCVYTFWRQTDRRTRKLYASPPRGNAIPASPLGDFTKLGAGEGVTGP